MAAITPEIQRKLYDEVDARFWAQTGYKPGQKLSKDSPLDRAFMPVWADIYSKVLREYHAGKLVYTANHPAVVSLIHDAEGFAADAAAHIGEVVKQIAGGAPAHAPEVKIPLQKAHEAHVASQQATAAAAAYQPPTASPERTARAHHDVMQFVMNGAGQGVPVVRGGADSVAVMQASAAPGKAAAQTADTPEQAAAAATHDDHPMHKFSGGEAIAIGASIVAALGLVAYGIEQHAAPRISRHFRRRALARRAA